MRTIVIGAGNSGRNLALRLSEEGHDAVLVDHRPGALKEAQSRMDVLTIEGHGCSPSVLESAGVSNADLLVAVTGDDEVNILACSIARSAGVAYRAARVGRDDYFKYPGRIDLAALGVDLAVNPIKACARELVRLLTLPGTHEVVDLLGGRALAAGFTLSTQSPLLRVPLKDSSLPGLLSTVRFIARDRAGEVQIPSGDTEFLLGDEVFVVAPSAAMGPFLDAAYPDRPRIRKVVISGGTDLGLELARQIESETELDVVLLESDPELAEFVSAKLKRALVLREDLLNADAIPTAGLREDTAFIATTDDDEANIISCLVAQKHGVCMTMARVMRPEYAPVIESLSLLDRAVSPHLSMMNAILRFVRGRNVRAAAWLDTLPGELIEVLIPPGCPWMGREIRSLKMPRHSIIASLLREEVARVPTGNSLIEAGDRLVIYALPDAVPKLQTLFRE
ncbi:MAG: Trk system potassium transporter TrkA [Kiritimatiellia bacterium]|nr:Trk system potassium transporter TrkA [Kiritimatiellia bacterium]